MGSLNVIILSEITFSCLVRQLLIIPKITTSPQYRRQSYKIYFVLKKTKLVLKTKTVHYLKIGLSNSRKILSEVTPCKENLRQN
jgi:hypothetical protein